MNLRKIPLESFIEILQELYEQGADYIDISEEDHINNKDVIKITVRPEYFINDREQYETDDVSSLSDDDINDLI